MNPPAVHFSYPAIGISIGQKHIDTGRPEHQTGKPEQQLREPQKHEHMNEENDQDTLLGKETELDIAKTLGVIRGFTRPVKLRDLLDAVENA